MKLSEVVEIEDKNTISEDAVGGSVSAGGDSGAGGGIAGVRNSLFPTMISRGPSKQAKRTAKMRRVKKIRETFAVHIVKEQQGANATFNTADVISKLSAAEDEHKFNRDTIPFGIEDDEGNVVKVYVRSDQAEDFERVLSGLVSDTAVGKKEVAEILFDLKDKFTIVHVQWPKVAEDEEIPAGETGAAAAAPADEVPAGDAGSEMDLSDMGTDTGEAPGEGEPEMDMGGTEDKMQSTLDKVIDMLKADAEAKQAEANAKAQEAKAKEAEYASKLADQKVKQEEEVLDMEAYFKKKDEEKKEAQKLAKMAQYRHGLANQAKEDYMDEDI